MLSSAAMSHSWVPAYRRRFTRLPLFWLCMCCEVECLRARKPRTLPAYPTRAPAGSLAGPEILAGAGREGDNDAGEKRRGHAVCARVSI